ncbi:Glycosyltransferase involved in cell wall bisynthesis [Catalinimonas alkaloidigena]|uniref:Glycosyltransferase involved in cell wall bisynthesis n=1 Tax=Catalinimonas alkaloidigena TaxID=1075417 RepID=A0A1G9LCV5_9BACT|nr:glycosyltransferase family 4 protein [Catalinimonas alkaloidigena]SDL59802.1 Glycosyltransferase involved in cell wall bisynthesis [Catalinimonas alkaloidigena]
MNLLVISPTADLGGGAEKAIVESIVGLAQSGHEVSLILPAPGPLVELLRDHVKEFFFLHFDWWITPKGALTSWQKAKFAYGFYTAAKKIEAVIAKVQPDWALTSTIATPVLAMAAKAQSVPHLWYIHEFGEADHQLPFIYGKSLSYRFINTSSQRIIVNSQAMHAFVSQYIPPQKLRLVYYSVAIPEKPNQPEQNPFKTPLQLLMMGRVSAGKRQEDAVAAVHLLKNKSIPVKLTIVGGRKDGYAAYITKKVEELSLTDAVEMVSFTAHPFRYYQEADVVLMCSVSEAFGRVTVEAMKMGKPVVASDTGANPELIGSNERGLLYRAGDVQHLADQIEALYRDPKWATHLAKEAWSWSWHNCNEEKHLQDLLQVLV